MKKFAVAVAVVALVAFAAPVFAATNPFMDVPMNHWAYDAIGQLAAHGILSGYPDGTYKGKQPTTRYEMASALARALAVVDMTKASKQDVEMLKKLVVEFKDELEALGVRVDDLDERVKVLEDRLGGWHMHGTIRFDINNYKDRPDLTPESEVTMSRARLFFERSFGEDESLFFRARLDNFNTSTNWQMFYVDIPFYFDSTLTVGRFIWDVEGPYYLGGDSDSGSFAALDAALTDRQTTALGWRKQFGLGGITAYVTHPDNQAMLGNAGFDAWELLLAANLQFTEQIGLDIGGQAFFGDNAEAAAELKFKNLWTIFGGLRFNFNDSIALKGIYYHQKWNGDSWLAGAGWRDRDQDGANYWKVIVDVDQELLKFTSLWLEYGRMDQYFVAPTGLDGSTFFAGPLTNGGDKIMGDDVKYWRVYLGQQWNEKWSTHLFYFGYDFDDWGDLKEWGLGVKFQYNPQVSFGLNFVKVDWSDENDAAGRADDHAIRFRTTVYF